MTEKMRKITEITRIYEKLFGGNLEVVKHCPAMYTVRIVAASSCSPGGANSGLPTVEDAN